MAEPRQARNTGNSAGRSPIGRAVLWAGIIILVGVGLYEFQVRATYQKNYDRLIKAFDEATAGDLPLKEAEIAKLVDGYSKKETENALPENHLSASRLDKYSYSGLVSGAREVYVYYRADEGGNGGLNVVAIRNAPLETE